MKSVAIIGAGACGLVLANLLSDDYKVTLLEKNSKLGKKILASGNGKCNFTNVGDYKNKYNNEFALKIVNKFDSKYTCKYFSSLGLVYRVDNENRAYPLSESSSSVLEVLKKGLKKTRILLDSRVSLLEASEDRVDVYYNDKVERFDYVVCCSGSNASNLGSDYAYSYLKEMNIEFTSLRPSLVPIVIKEDIKILNGVRSKCLVKLYKDGELIHQEKGEVLFKDDSLSGIVIYNISSIINRDLSGNYKIALDLLNDACNKIEIKDLVGVVHPKIVEYLNAKNKKLEDMIFTVIKMDKKENAQVISGGVNLLQVNDNLSLKKYPNIYLGGEVLDCDGVCGGFNLQFAFSCAFTINDSIRNNK